MNPDAQGDNINWIVRGGQLVWFSMGTEIPVSG